MTKEKQSRPVERKNYNQIVGERNFFLYNQNEKNVLSRSVSITNGDCGW